MQTVCSHHVAIEINAYFTSDLVSHRQQGKFDHLEKDLQKKMEAIKAKKGVT